MWNDLTPPPGAIPQAMHGNTGAIPVYHAPPPQQPPEGPKTWQVIAGFLGAAAIIVGGTWTIATTVFLSKESYLRDQAVQMKTNTELQSAAANVTASTAKLQSTIETLDMRLQRFDAKIADLDNQIDRSNSRRRAATGSAR